MSKQNAAEIKTYLSGHFTMTVRKPDGSIRLIAEFDNLITNTGLEQYGLKAPSGTAIITTCVVGTGTTAPAFSDTNLVNQIAFTNATNPANSPGAFFNVAASRYVRYRQTFRFAAGTATGNLTEVGIRAEYSASGPLFSRALILDGNGSPTSITILSDETLDVTYEIRGYQPSGDVTGTITLGGNNYNYVLRIAQIEEQNWCRLNAGGSFPANHVAYSGDIGAENSVPSGFVANASGSTFASYVNGSRYLDATFTFGLANGSTDFKSLLLYTSLGRYQIGFTPVIPKTGSNVFSLTLRYSWARRTS